MRDYNGENYLEWIFEQEVIAHKEGYFTIGSWLKESKTITYEWIKYNIFYLYYNKKSGNTPLIGLFLSKNKNLDYKIIEEIYNQYKDLL
jgi:hypothetical protein